jgi:hypothetical protein
LSAWVNPPRVTQQTGNTHLSAMPLWSKVVTSPESSLAVRVIMLSSPQLLQIECSASPLPPMPHRHLESLHFSQTGATEVPEAIGLEGLQRSKILELGSVVGRYCKCDLRPRYPDSIVTHLPRPPPFSAKRLPPVTSCRSANLDRFEPSTFQSNVYSCGSCNTAHFFNH